MNDALNNVGSEAGDRRLKLRETITGGVTALNYWSGVGAWEDIMDVHYI